jgi:hypothetical protein
MMVMLSAILPLGASYLEQTLARGGYKVERRVSSHINNGGSQQRGAAESRRRMHVEVCTLIRLQRIYNF